MIDWEFQTIPGRPPLPGPDFRPPGRRSVRRARTMNIVVSVLVCTTGCATSLSSLPTSGPVEPWCCARGEESITLEYLGTGGWLMRMGDAAILTAPFFSNPRMLDVGLGRLEPDTALIAQYMPPAEDVDALLVGHAHYDHLMDVPYILRTFAPEARMYGSHTAVNLLLGDSTLVPDRLVSVEDRAGDAERPGAWHEVAGGRIRFMALRSGHAPHFLGIHLYQGQLDEPATELPSRAGGWLEGTPLAYLIDFLGPRGEVVYRIHYQDAASTPPEGFPPPLPALDGIPIDLAILCAPGYEEVENYPEGILARLEPRHVIVGHWEDFFHPRDESLRAVPGTDLVEFLQRMEAALPDRGRWSMPEPGTVIAVTGELRR
jgi:hypothetical protein